MQPSFEGAPPPNSAPAPRITLLEW